MGRGPGDPARGARQPVLGVAPVRAGVRPVRARRRRALQRHVRAPRRDCPAAARELLGGLERAQLRRGPRPAGDRRLDGVGGAGDVPSARRPDVERAAGDRPRARHGPDRRVRAAGAERPRATRPSPGPSGQLRPDQAAAVPAHAVLRRLHLSRATRTGGGSRRLSVDGRRLAPLRGRIRRCSTPPGSPITRIRDGEAPTTESSTDPDIAPFPRLPDLERALDRLQRMYGSNKRFPIYNTEYGYITHPPNRYDYRLAGDRRVLHQLGRVPELEAAAGRDHDAVPALRPDADRRHVPGDGGFASGLRPSTASPSRRTPPTACRCSCRSPRRGAAARSRCGDACGRRGTRSRCRVPSQTAQIQFAPGSSGAAGSSGAGSSGAFTTDSGR